VNLEQLRKQAKERVRAGQAAKLADAQRTLAREHGYSSWPALVHALEGNAEAFLRAATYKNRVRAERFLAASPELARDPWVALTLGRGWDGDPNEPGGPLGWAPILYVAHSAFAPVDQLRELLARGADPKASFVNEYGPMSAVYGAAGVVHDPGMTRVLLEAGADPNDGESVYHACEAESTECLHLLLEHGARVPGTNALAHALDYPHLEHVRLLLDAGGDPNEGALLYHAVIRGRDAETLRYLVERGTRPDPAAYRPAVRRGRADQIEALEALGITEELTDVDRGLAAIARGEPAGRLPAELDPDARETLILAALWRNVELVVDAVGPNFRGRVSGSPEGSLLHHAAWVGQPGVVERLLERGADPGADADPPIWWAALGSQYHAEPPDRDYVAVVELLEAAGNALEPRLLEVAEGPLYDWLEERL
jgi:ankyrin repeat protein